MVPLRKSNEKHGTPNPRRVQHPTHQDPYNLRHIPSLRVIGSLGLCFLGPGIREAQLHVPWQREPSLEGFRVWDCKVQGLVYWPHRVP